MKTINECLILAAGNGSRIASLSGSAPKPLVPLFGAPLLEHILLSANRAGIDRFVIVVGYRADAIRHWLADQCYRDFEIMLVENPDYHKANGVSALAAKAVFRNPFLLLMADHIFEPKTARALLQQRLAADQVILGVDHNIHRIFDLEDATKVQLRGNDIVDIGKDLSRFDALDTGMFLCTPSLFERLDSAKKMAIAPCLMECARRPASGNSNLSMSATDTGKTSIHPKLSPTPNPSSNATSRRAQSCKGSRMFKVPTNLRPALRVLAIGASAGLFLYLVWHAGPLTLWRHLQRLAWGFSLVIALAGVSHLAKTWAWQMTLGQERHKIPFPRLVGLRLGAEAAGQLGILGQTVGDSIRVSHLGREIHMGTSLASVTLDRGLYLVTGITIAIAGLLAALSQFSLSHALRLYAGLFILAATAFLLLTLVALRMCWPLLTGTARVLRRIPSLKNWTEQRLEVIESMEKALFDFHHKTPARFWASFSLNIATQFLAILEVCLVLRLLGTNIGFFGALIIEALTKLVNAIGNFNPGNLGTYEGGNVLIGRIFSLTNATGLALAFARRLRVFFWTAVGGVCLLWLTGKSSNLRAERVANELSGKTAEPQDRVAGHNSSPDGITVAIALNAAGVNLNGLSPALACVGGLPILLRTILGAQKLNPTKLFVVADSTTRERVRKELADTGRLPNSVEWLDENADAFLPRQLRVAARQTGSRLLVLIDGGATYHPSLIRQASTWSASDNALALKSGDKFAGIYAVPGDLLDDWMEPCTQNGVFKQLLTSLTANESLVSVEIGADQWQRVNTERERRTAEKKLDRWLIKPTDGMYAQLNRKISIPISRQLIKLPVTANMVSIFTLGVGFCSAAFFAIGGYWNTLLGAFLCLFASILDGCDGEVARLKLLESDFGCWLETVCDYVFYLVLLVGMTIGQVRSSGSMTYLVAGGLLLVGALASFLAVGRGRQRLAGDRPEQFLRVWRTHAENQRSNPVLYIARHTEFMVRRCFFPYALCVFAVFNIMSVAFVLSVIGANLVWPISLYSSRTFGIPPTTIVVSPAASP